MPSTQLVPRGISMGLTQRLVHAAPMPRGRYASGRWEGTESPSISLFPPEPPLQPWSKPHDRVSVQPQLFSLDWHPALQRLRQALVADKGRTNTTRPGQSRLHLEADDLKSDWEWEEKRRKIILSSSKVLLWVLSQKMKFN